MAVLPSDWQLNSVSINQRGVHILQSGLWSDCSFQVGTEPQRVTIPAHKLILAMASPVFEAMFFGGMPETNNAIHIQDIQPDAFKALLEYIYTDNINISSFDKACELCYCAKKYMLPHLVKECTKYMWSDLNPKNACRAYEFAKLFDENELLDKCLQIICTHTKEVLNDSSFEEADLNTVITVFSQDNLNIDTELDLFDAAVRYSKAQEKRNQERSTTPGPENPSPAPSTSKENISSDQAQQVVNIESSAENSPEAVVETCKSVDTAEPAPSPKQDGDVDKSVNNPAYNSKPTIRNAVEKIRFLTLTPQEFACRPARSSLLSESESFAVLMNILSSSSDVGMPRGFSTCRVPRPRRIGVGTQHMGTLTVDTPSPVMVEQVFGHPQQHCYNPLRLDVPGGEHGQVLPPVGMFDRAEFSKLFCQRSILQHTECYNASVLDCSVTFMVDKNICLLGVQVPTQSPCEEGAACGAATAATYPELLYAHLLDSDGSRLTYTHYTNRVAYRSLLDIMFNRPVFVQRNKVYKVGVVFNKAGWYPMGRCSQRVAAESVFFNFGIGQTCGDSFRDGLIRSIIFTYSRSHN